ncbi:M23 family metallopeptidase [Candidatus Daviesbacteria bacterium]|nr:M23 family metallopeptidase [Candidatus Daviesbacteria bacterium]
MKSTADDFKELIGFITPYFKRKTVVAAAQFEDFKNWSVDRLMHRRGVLQKHVWHGSMVALSAFGVITSGVFGGQTIVSSSFPGVGGSDPRFAQAYEYNPNDPILNSLFDTHTQVSQKPRAEIITYQVEGGDTLSSIAEKFGISTDTIKWANDLADKDSIKPGQQLKILPVSGIAYTVKSGDTLQSVAKKFSADAQSILDFPFNDIPNDFSLKAGQVLIVPDGVPPEVPAPVRPQPQYVAQGSQGPSGPTYSAPGGANFIWPTRFVYISQYFAWYHPGIDMPNPGGPAVVAADGGTVVVAGWPDGYGYGNRVVIDHGNGYQSLYAHLSNVYVSAGQVVSRGQTIGQMGSTGRSTGTHLHFEIHYKGIAVNPLAILK